MNECYLYRHYAADDTLLYVGVSLSAVYRLAQHRQTSDWFGDIARVAIEKFPSRAEALSAETKAIQTENPKHNVVKRKRTRPASMEDALFSDSPAHETSALEIVERVVRLAPLYTIDDAALLLKLRPTSIRRLVEAKRLGHIMLPGRIKPRMYITGWQIIAFLENEEEKTKC